MTFVTAYLSCKDAAIAQTIADALLNAKLIACAKIVPGVASSYLWKGAIEHASEVLLVMDTHESRLLKIEETIKPLHNYDVFVLTATPLSFISKEAGAWLQESINLLGGS